MRLIGEHKDRVDGGLRWGVEHRYTITTEGIRKALFLTRLSQRFLLPGMAQVTGPSPPAYSTLRAAARDYEAAVDDLAIYAGLAA